MGQPLYCWGCTKIRITEMEGLHPYVDAIMGGCTVYNGDLDWVARRGGCAFNPVEKEVKKVKVNPLKASKRGGSDG